MNFPYKSTSYFILLSLLVPRTLGCPDLSVFLRKKTMVVSVPAQSHRDGGEESQAHCPPMGDRMWFSSPSDTTRRRGNK